MFLLVLLGTMLGTMEVQAQRAVITSDGKTMYFCKDQSEAQSLGSQIFSIAIFTAGQSPAWYNNSAVDLTKITTVEFLPSFAEATNIRSAKDWFHGMTRLTSVKGVQNIDASSLWEYTSMFEGCSSLEFFYMSAVTSESQGARMTNMFKDCSKLKFVDLANFSKVLETDKMFSGCTSLKVLDLSSFKKSSNYTMREMFSGCSNLQTIHVGKGWQTASFDDAAAQNMFYGCTSLVGGNGTAYDASYVGKEYARIDTEGTPGYFTNRAPYVVYNDGVLVFYNDGDINSRVGTKYTIYENPVPNNDHILTGVYADGNYKNVRAVTFYASFDTSPYCKNYSGYDLGFRWFYNMENLTHIGPMQYFNTSHMTSMASLFEGCKSLTSLEMNLNYFDTRQVTNMNNMFRGCESLTSLDLGVFNTQKVTECILMFAGCTNLKHIQVGEDWNVQQVTNTNSQSMFTGCTSLVGGAGTVYSSANLNRFYAIIDGGTSSPGYLSASPYAVLSSDKTTLTFYNDGKRKEKTGTKYSIRTWIASTLANVTKVTFDVSFVTARPISTANWFDGASKLTTIERLEYLKTGEVTTMEKMFYGCESLTSVNVSDFNTGNVTNMGSMFCGCKSLTSLNVSSFNTANVTNMGSMFRDCPGLTLLDLSSFNTANVTSMQEMFRRDSQLATIFVSSKWNTNKVTASYGTNMFEGCTVLKGGAGTVCDGVNNIGKAYARADKADTPGYLSYKPYAVYQEAINRLFFYADGRPEVKIGTVYDLKRTDAAPGWYSDGSYVNVQVVDFDASFANARPLTAYSWFYGMTTLRTISNIEYLNTEEVTNMQLMFYGCSALEMLNLSHFNTSKVTNMVNMFRNCSNLKTVYVSDEWTTDKVSSSGSMFTGCTAIVGGNGTEYNSSKTNKEYARIDAEGTPGYFTLGPPAYAVLSGSTLTFYADGNPTEKTGTKYDIPTDRDRVDPDWYSEETITKVVFDESFASARPTSTYGWFLELENLTTIEGIEYLNTSKVTTMQNMFRNTKLTTIDLSYFNTAKVRDMYYMFAENPQLTTILVGKNWSIESLSSVYQDLFGECPNLVGGAGTTWDSSQIYATYAHVDRGPSNPGYFTWSGAEPYVVYDAATTTLTFYNDGDLSSKTGTIYYLNESTVAPQWFTDNVSQRVTTVVFDPSFAEARPTNTNDWFVAMRNLTSIEGIEYLNTSEVTNMTSMFSLCESLESVDVSGFDTRKVTTMNSMFNECNALKRLDLTSFDVSQVTNMQQMFSNCSSLTTIFASSNWSEEVDESLNSWHMFTGCTSLVGGGGTEWDSSYSNDINQAIIDGGEMDPGYFSYKPYAAYDLTSNVLTLYNDGKRSEKTGKKLFELNDGANFPGWIEVSLYVTKVVFDESFASARPTSTYCWFSEMYLLKEIEGLEYLNTSEVTNMESMFGNASSLEGTLDLSHFDTHKVTTMHIMFWNCKNITTIYVGSGWNTLNVTDGLGMFYNCAKLVGGRGTACPGDVDGEWDDWSITYAHVDGGSNNPGYFTAKPLGIMGDVNGDEQVNVADVTALVNMLNADNAEYTIEADIDGDGSLTNIDAKALVYQILGGHALMYVEDVFTLSTSGRTVATGQILKGMFSVGQPIVLRSISDAIPDVEFDIISIEKLRKLVDVAVAGENVGIGVDVVKDNVHRGDVLTIKDNPDLLHSKTVKGTLYLYTKDEGGRHTPMLVNYTPTMLAGGVSFALTCTNLGTVDGQAVEMVMPGSTCENIVFEVVEDGKTPYVYPGQVVYLREDGRTIGRLTITE